MAIVSDVEIRLRADIARLQQDMNAARRSVGGAMDGISQAVGMAKKALGALGVGLGIKEMVMQVVNAQREFDKLNSSLITATGSTANAAQAFKALQSFAATTPFSVKEATEAFIKLRNLGLNPSEAALRSYGNTASAQGKSLNQFIEAVADAATGEFERLKEFGIKAKQNGDQVALTFQGTTKLIGNNAKEIEKYLQHLGDVDFAGAMARRAETLDGAISNLGDTYDGFLRKVAANGAGQAFTSAVLALSGALTDLGAIFDAIGGKAKKEGEAIKEASTLHKALTTIFEAVAVLGVNVAYVFEQVGLEIGGLAAQAAAVMRGDFKGAAMIGAQMKTEAEEARVAVDAKTAAILGASAAAQQAQDAETANLVKNGKDRLEQYQVVLTAEQLREKAAQESLDLRNRLNGVNKETAGELVKLKAALDTGAISQAEYTRYMGLMNKATVESSTSYKEQVKRIDLTTEAIRRRAAAQEFDNKQSALTLEFLNRTGQLGDEDLITKTAGVDVKTIQEGTAALREQLALAGKKIDNEKEVAALRGQIAQADHEINARRKKEEQDLFELEQKRYRGAVNNTADLIEAAQQESAAQRGVTVGMRDEIATLGLTGRALAEVTAARLRDKAEALDRRAEIGIIQEVNDELHKQADELRAQADLGLTKERAQEQQQFWGDIEKTAHDTFLSIADGSKNMWQRMKDTAKNVFFDWLYQMTVKKWIINIGASISGTGAVSGIAGAADAIGGAGNSGGTNWMGIGQSIYNGFENGFSSIGSSLGGYVSQLGNTFGSSSVSAFGSGMGLTSSQAGEAAAAYNSAGMTGTGSALTSGSAAGTVAGAAGAFALAATIGRSLGNAISQGYATNITSSKAMVNWSTLLSPVPILGGMIGGLVNRAFGRKAKQYDPTMLNGTLGNDGFSGTFDTAWKQKGGWFHSDRSGVDKAPVDNATATMLTDTYKAITWASAGFARTLGAEADSIANRTQAFSLQLGADQEANQKAIVEYFTKISDAVATELLPNIAQFQHSGEGAAQTLERLAGEFQVVDGVLNTFGLTGVQAFQAVGTASIEARTRLVQLAGGVDALAQQTQFFADNFLTRAQQIAPLQRQVAETLTTLGYSNLLTKEQYSKAVTDLASSGALATEAGAKLYTELMKLGPAFKAVADYSEEMQAASRDVGRQQADEALAELTRAVDAQKNVAMAAYDAVMGRLNAGIDTVNATIERTGDLSRALKAAVGTVESPAQQEGMRKVAQAQITASLAIAKAGGALPTAEDLRDALAALGRDASGQFSSLADYQREVARTNNELLQLGGMSDAQLSTAERQLLVLQEQAALTKAASDIQLGRLDAMVTNAQAQVSALAAANTSLNDIYLAINSLWRQSTQLNYGPQQTLGTEMVRQLDAPMPNYTAPSATINSDAAILAALQALESRMANVETNTQRAAAASAQFAAQFDQVSAGGNALATEAVGR